MFVVIRNRLMPRCTRADKSLALNEWASFASTLQAHRDNVIKITRVPVTPLVSDPTDSHQLAAEIEQLVGVVGSQNVLFGSPIDDQAVWQQFDAATRWASAHQRDQLFRQNAVSFYSL